MNENGEMRKLADELYDYFRERFAREELGTALTFYRAEVTAAASGGKITVRRPQDTAVSLPYAWTARNLAAGDQALVVMFGSSSNAFVIGDAALTAQGFYNARPFYGICTTAAATAAKTLTVDESFALTNGAMVLSQFTAAQGVSPSGSRTTPDNITLGAILPDFPWVNGSMEIYAKSAFAQFPSALGTFTTGSTLQSLMTALNAMNGGLFSGWFAYDSGTGLYTLSSSGTELDEGNAIIMLGDGTNSLLGWGFLKARANTFAAVQLTLNVNGTGARPVIVSADTPFVPTDAWKGNEVVQLVYDATTLAWRMVGTPWGSV